MHPTHGQSSGRSSAGSSRFPKSVACIIATSGGRHDLASPESPTATTLRPTLSFRQFALIPSRGSVSFGGALEDADCPSGTPCSTSLVRSGPCHNSPGCPSTESDAVLAKDMAHGGSHADLPHRRRGHRPSPARRLRRVQGHAEAGLHVGDGDSLPSITCRHGSGIRRSRRSRWSVVGQYAIRRLAYGSPEAL